MPRVRVDDALIPAVNGPITFDAVLSAMEPVLALGGRIVTAVRFDGVEEPAFREPDVRARPLADDTDVEVETTSPSELAAGALDDAVRLLPGLSTAACGVANQWRLGDVDDAAPALGSLAEGLALLAALVQSADLWAARAGLGASGWLGDDVVGIERAIAAIQTGVADRDWVAAADALEHDLTAALDLWRERLEAGAIQVHAAQSGRSRLHSYGTAPGGTPRRGVRMQD